MRRLYALRPRHSLIHIKAHARNLRYARHIVVTSLPAIASSPSTALPLALRFHSTLTVVRALFVLTKPRLAFFSILTALVAYATAVEAIVFSHALFTLLGTTFAAAGALSLNQWWERRTDALMRRTRQRPLPAAEISPGFALLWSLSLSLAGILLLALTINLSSAAFAAATILLYGIIYTPLKRRTRWATEVGSLSGALPPLLGCAAAGNLASPHGWSLAAILLFWQMPHFFAIGWRYRADYRAADFPLLPAIDETGARTAAWSCFYAVLTVAASITPCILGLFGPLYAATALIAGLLFLRAAFQFHAATPSRDVAARRLFLASILYLPALLLASATSL